MGRKERYCHAVRRGWISHPICIIHMPVFYGLALAWGVALLDDALRSRRAR
ncbi:MAG: hypothetical protein ABI702_04700 [Burkholderiales bacterium]